MLGKHLSAETKQKIGEKNKIKNLGKKASRETKDKMSKSQKDRYANWTEEERINFGKTSSEKASGYTWSDESKSKMKNNKNGATHTEEEIRQIRFMHEQEGKSVKEIASLLNYSYDFVYRIITYKRWKDI